MKSQINWIVSQLKEKGEISRNTALKNYISRLGAYIWDLKKEGWKFKTETVKTPYGKDYVYKVVSEPKLEQVRLF